ncbi:uncharacterized protein N7483_010776 [Penicillium malachiteum]|uniref:uncharacterized protein n=1 Tax=Penicillium malachiteum TaxID=1324776 RepID=UPI0025483C3F|nr:uncharacterized protein N7483_010776 [Penicillium malachiteum]KAJ5713595.1 hypothetical protein N7483_010776 [Penicillium malachiteum]
MEVKKDGKRTHQHYTAMNVMQLKGAAKAIEEFETSVLPRGTPKEEYWVLKSGEIVNWHLEAGPNSPIYTTRCIDGSLVITVDPGMTLQPQEPSKWISKKEG